MQHTDISGSSRLQIIPTFHASYHIFMKILSTYFRFFDQNSILMKMGTSLPIKKFKRYVGNMLLIILSS